MSTETGFCLFCSSCYTCVLQERANAFAYKKVIGTVTSLEASPDTSASICEGYFSILSFEAITKRIPCITNVNINQSVVEAMKLSSKPRYIKINCLWYRYIVIRTQDFFPNTSHPIEPWTSMKTLSHPNHLAKPKLLSNIIC